MWNLPETLPDIIDALKFQIMPYKLDHELIIADLLSYSYDQHLDALGKWRLES
jgi:hypothetical protein